MATNDALARANQLFYTAVAHGRADTIATIGRYIWSLVAEQVSAELAGETV